MDIYQQIHFPIPKLIFISQYLYQMAVVFGKKQISTSNFLDKTAQK
ncbi:MAG: hypothetical protein ACI9GZ_004604 [Bacteroidia bacterium]